MKANKINALSTAIIAFVTVISLMVGFYYNLKASNVDIIFIVIFELLFLIMVWLFIIWLRRKLKHEE